MSILVFPSRLQLHEQRGPCVAARRSVSGNCAQRAPAYKNGMTVATTTATAAVTTTTINKQTITITTTARTTERRYECGSGVRRRPRLLKVRDGSVAETLPSFAFNPDPHFVGAWSILHLPPFPVAAVLKLFLPPRLGQPGERAPHCLSFSPAISARVPFSLPVSRSSSSRPSRRLTPRFPTGVFLLFPSPLPLPPPPLAPSWITICSWNTMNNNGRRAVGHAGHDR